MLTGELKSMGRVDKMVKIVGLWKNWYVSNLCSRSIMSLEAFYFHFSLNYPSSEAFFLKKHKVQWHFQQNQTNKSHFWMLLQSVWCKLTWKAEKRFHSRTALLLSHYCVAKVWFDGNGVSDTRNSMCWDLHRSYQCCWHSTCLPQVWNQAVGIERH